MTRLNDLFEKEGQSPWLDNLRRDWLESGELADWVAKGVRGVTSNPSIFEKAMADTDDYDHEFKELIAHGKDVTECYWDLVVSDILGALEVLKPIYDSSEGTDGFVSVEVDPRLARDTSGTLDAARSLHKRINKPNVLIKIPATRESLPAVQTMISEGRSVNVTLIFSLSRYAEVMEAYISGLENFSGDLSKISSVASFFISRTDTEVDKRLDGIGSQMA
ncbi:MAG TPA: transaldolase family protein, partial [Acidimicrobiales bacterium]|nr:transaldolase family protein [Acidimicrobiales bacterium]